MTTKESDNNTIRQTSGKQIYRQKTERQEKKENLRMPPFFSSNLQRRQLRGKTIYVKDGPETRKYFLYAMKFSLQSCIPELKAKILKRFPLIHFNFR